MTDETVKTENDGASEEKAAKTGSGLMSYIIYGVVGIVVVAGAIFGTLMFMGDDKAAATDGEVQDEQHAEASPTKGESADGHGGASAHSEWESPEDSILASLEADQSVIDEISQSLAFLDYEPDMPDENGEDHVGLTPEDSLEKVSWFESETIRLATWEKTLAEKQKALDITDKKVSQQIARIEQTESNRVSNLAKLYDGMEARSVAKLMANLDDATVVSILPRMKQKNASEVLAIISSKRAAKLSKQMITISGE